MLTAVQFWCLYHFDWRLFVCKEITVLVAVLREEAASYRVVALPTP
jgi:hypothetical protein